MTYSIIYHPRVVSEDIPKLGTAERRRIKRAIEQKLAKRPEVFGIPLRYSLKGSRKLRVGDHRVIFRIQQKEIFILIIQHRSAVYQNLHKRN